MYEKQQIDRSVVANYFSYKYKVKYKYKYKVKDKYKGAPGRNGAIQKRLSRSAADNCK